MEIATHRHIDLFSGLGGFALAAQANGIETEIFCENNPRCREFLDRVWRKPVIDDVRHFDGARWRGRWLLTAGVPCQPASRAGQQRGADDDRWLWPEVLRIVAESRPAWTLFENPPGILDVGLDGIIVEMGRLGYEIGLCSIPACAVDSPQDRERIWIIGRRTETLANGTEPRPQGCHTELSQRASGRAPECVESSLANSGASGQSRACTNGGQPDAGTDRWYDSAWSAWSDFQWIECHEHGRAFLRRFPHQLHGLDDGLPKCVLEALGNAIVWPVAAEIIKAMKNCE